LTEDEVLGKFGIYIREIVVCWFGWEARLARCAEPKVRDQAAVRSEGRRRGGSLFHLVSGPEGVVRFRKVEVSTTGRLASRPTEQVREVVMW
jgi:hypothetical protein